MDVKTIRIQIPNQILTLSEREKIVNEQILKLIDSFRKEGFFTKQHEIINRTSSFYSVRFTLLGSI
jgi:hypothetical protein